MALLPSAAAVVMELPWLLNAEPKFCTISAQLISAALKSSYVYWYSQDLVEIN